MAWIKLHRKILDSLVFSDFDTLGVWIWCLCRANHKPRFWKGEEIRRGEFITGRKVGAEECGLSESAFYRRLQKLQKWEMVKLEANSKWTRVSVCNYTTYQDTDESERTTSEQRADNERTTSEQRADTNKKVKKEEKEKKIKNNPQTPTGDCPTPQQFFDRWNAFVSGKAKLKKVIKLTDKRKQQIKVRLSEDGWFEAFKSAVLVLPLGGDGWQPTFDWFIRNESNAYRLAEGEFEWRSKDDPAMQRLQQTIRQKETLQREERLLEEKERRKREKSGTRKAIDAILHPKNGDGGGQDESSLLFGDMENSIASGAET